MTSQPPPPPPPPARADAPSTRPWYRQPWIGWVAGGLIGLLAGVVLGATPAPDGELAAQQPAPAETVTVTETTEPRPAETVTVRETADAAPAPAETVTVTETAEPDQPAAQRGGDGTATATAGQWQFTDVQIRRDGIDDFEVRARVTNTGSTVDGVIWTATIFIDGSVVATAQASASDVDGGSTTTQTFTTTDDFIDGTHTIEFQVDTQF